MAEIILVNPYPEGASGINEGTVEPPLGLGYLAAIAEKYKNSCRIIDANILRMNAGVVLSEIKKESPKIIGITINLFTYQSSIELVNRIKQNIHNAIVILGGPTPTSNPLKIINKCAADAVAVGEGEETFAEIVNNYNNGRPLFDGVNGIIYRSGDKIIHNGPRDFVKNIDEIPFPAYHLFPDLAIYKTRARKSPVAPLLTSRGCPYQCVYCSKDVFKHVCRMRTPENVIGEIDMLVKKYGVRQIDILDDNFTIHKDRMERILDLIIERKYDLCVNLQTGVRTENLDQNVISKMRKAKIWKMPIGVESGDLTILKNIKKKLDLNRVLEVTRIAKKAGIKVYGFFMMGLPGDTAESMQRTINFAIKMNPNVASFGITIPFPGTELYDLVKKEGKFLRTVDDGINDGFFANKVFYTVNGMNEIDVLRYYKKAMRTFYFRPRKMFEMLSSIRSKDEFKWLFNTSISVIRNLSRKSVA